METALLLSLLPQLAGLHEVTDAGYASMLDLHAAKMAKSIQTVLPFAALVDGEYRIREEKMAGVLDVIAKLARRAEKLGVPLPTIEVLRRETIPVLVTFTDPCDPWRHCWARTGELRAYVVVRPTIEPVRLPGWTFAATIQHLGEDGNLLRTSPRFETPLPVAYRTDPPSCDHCHTIRRRTETFVLRHDDGHFARVGRNCLADYLGGKSAEMIIAAAAIELALTSALEDDWSDGEGGYGYGGVSRVDPVRFLAAVALVIEKHGWLSRKVARDTGRNSTASEAWEVLFPPLRSIMNTREGQLTRSMITPAHHEDAEKAIAWAVAIPVDTDSDYLHNCRVVAGLGAWGGGEIGIGAAILMSFQKEQDRLKRMEFERRLPSIYLGSVGDKFGMGKGKKATPWIEDVRVLGIYTTDGMYGMTTIVRMQAVAADGEHVHDLVWFASGTVDLTVDAEVIAAKAAAQDAWQAARNAADAAHGAPYKEWCASESDVFISYEKWFPENVGRFQAEEDRTKALADAAWAALCNIDDANATRPVAVGDLLRVAGTVKAQKVSDRTKRPETVLTRCQLRLVSAAADEMHAMAAK